MIASRPLLAMIFTGLLYGCAATPTIRLDSGEMAMQVKAKAPIVTGATFSPDGKTIVTESADNVARLWSPTSAKLLAGFRDTGIMQGSAAYSPDGKMIAVASARGMTIFSAYVTKLFDAATGKVRAEIEDFGGKLSFSPDSKILLGSSPPRSTKIKIWDFSKGKFTHEFTGQYGQISPDGRQVLVTTQKTLEAFDLNTGLKLWKADITNGAHSSITAVSYSPDAKKIVAAIFTGEMTLIATPMETISYVELDTATGTQIRKFGAATATVSRITGMGLNAISDLAVSPDGTFFLTGSNGYTGRYNVRDMKTGVVLRELRVSDETTGTIMNNFNAAVGISPSGKVGMVTTLASTQMFDLATGKELAKFIGFEDGEWLITTPSGYYSASEKGDEYLDVRVGGKAYTIAQLREAFFRPDLVKLAMSGEALTEYRTIANVKQPPEIRIVDTPRTTSQEHIAVSISVKDQGGGIGDVRVYRNGTAVVLEKASNLSVSATSQADHVLRYQVLLEPGTNVIRVIVFNADNSMQSTDATVEIRASFAPRPPALYAVVVGIKDYVNPRLALTYPVADAELFAATLEDKGRGLFGTIRIRRLLKPEETTSSAIAVALKQAQKDVRPEDLFVFYVASHGTVDDGEYFLLTSNVGSTSTARLKQDALSQDALKGLISNIPASKKLIVLDTCNAGKLGDVLQVAILTRGMSDDTAMKVLSRAVGSTILSAASSVQEALEGYNGHGLFTWVVVEGLKGAADADKDGFVKTLELADYVDNQVPELAERIFKHRQFPVVSPSGQGFPVVKVK